MRVVKLQENETVQRDGQSYAIGDKVYGGERAGFGVGTVEKIQLFGVHFGFRALISSTILDEPIWVDSKNISKHPPEWAPDSCERATTIMDGGG